MTPPTYSPWLKAFELLGRLGFTQLVPDGVPGPVGSERADCEGDLGWQRLLEPRALYQAWAPPAASPWSGYARPTLFAALRPRATVLPDDVRELPTGLASGFKPRLPERTAVILDLPGATSVALGAWLARWAGFQPVVLFNNWPHPRGIVPIEKALAALLYYAPWVTQDRDLRGTTAPPVFILDRMRLGRNPRVTEFDNRYYHLDADFPSPATLKRGGIDQVLYVAPHDAMVLPSGVEPPAVVANPFVWAPPGSVPMRTGPTLRGASDPAVLRGWIQSGVPAGSASLPDSGSGMGMPPMQAVPPTAGMPPMPTPAVVPPVVMPGGDMDDINPYLRDVRKTLGLAIAFPTPGKWELGTGHEFSPAQRKTPFNTTKDPRFAGFRRASVGGFGKMIPEPSSSGGGGFGGGFG